LTAGGPVRAIDRVESKVSVVSDHYDINVGPTDVLELTAISEQRAFSSPKGFTLISFLGSIRIILNGHGSRLGKLL
jgi:hypothetical protein